MEKTKEYQRIVFTADVLRSAINKIVTVAKIKPSELRYLTLKVEHDDSDWEYDSFDEFLADYRKFKWGASLHVIAGDCTLVVWKRRDLTRINVRADSRSSIESIFEVFESTQESCRLPPVSEPNRVLPSPPVIFIGHGQSTQWRDLKDHLQEKHEYKIEAYETGARAGHTIRDILEEMVTKSSFAVLVLTAEDEQADGNYRARQNVIHETGLFQGRLGFHRAIMLLEEDVEALSNVQGIQYIRFSQNNIKETYGEVLATLRREFPS